MKYLIFLGFMIGTPLFGQMIDENALFQQETLITEAPPLTNTPSKGVFLTGKIQSQFSYALQKDKLTHKESQATNRFSHGIEGDIFIDMRQEEGYKAFVDVGFLITAGGIPLLHTFIDPLTMTSFSVIETNTIILQAKEAFVDFPLFHLFYLRLGKQYLAWGTTYFWNPTDLLNRERKTLTKLTSTREGIWGIKLHIPYKTLLNWYTFFDMTDTQTLENIALASRIEAVLGNTEIGLCGWWRKDWISVYGADLSSRFLDWDIKAEGSVSYGDNRPVLQEDILSYGPVTVTNYTLEKITNAWVYRIALNFSRSWELWDVKERLSTMVEVFYNSQGKNDHLFENPTKTQVALLSGAYVPHEYGKWYGLVSLGFRKLFLTELSSQTYILCNIEDKSATLSQTLTYAPLDEVQASCGVVWYTGEEKREYTTTETPLVFTVQCVVRF
ncbi:MAG: hypothetical protein N2314_02110 [Brevinematales bacterium]|nr:hypothetical protein [Brevinematales bacterium]